MFKRTEINTPSWMWSRQSQTDEVNIGSGEGKWMLFFDVTLIVAKWEQVCAAVELGILWKAKRCIHPNLDENFAIVIYTRNSTDLIDVIQTLDYLEASGIKEKESIIYYKTDRQTSLCIYSGNENGQRAWTYSSDSIRRKIPDFSAVDIALEQMLVPKLILQFMPTSAWLTDIKQVLSSQAWQQLCECTLQENTGCGACGCEDKNELQCSSLWSFDEFNKIQRLEKLEVSCRSCCEIRHLNPNAVSSDKLSYVGQINQWNEATCSQYFQMQVKLWGRRSQIQWNVDIHWLKDRGYTTVLPSQHVYIVSDLMHAVLNSEYEKIHVLLSLVKTKKAMLEKNQRGETILCVAIRHGDENVLQILLSFAIVKKHLLEIGYQGKPPLHLAIELNAIGAMKQLLEAGADPFSHDKFNRFALHCAAINNNLMAARLLLSVAPSLSLFLDRFWRRAVDYAVMSKNDMKYSPENEEELFSIFVDPLHEADFLFQDLYGKTLLHHAISGLSVNALEELLTRDHAIKILNTVDRYHKTALHVAAIAGCEDKLKVLLNHGANSDIVSNQGHTAYMEACFCAEIGNEKAAAIFWNTLSQEEKKCFNKEKLEIFDLKDN